MSNSNINLQTQSLNALHNAIMEAGSKDRPPMLAPGNYVQWKSKIKRYIDTKPNSELIHYCLQNPPYTYQWAEKTVPVAEGSSETTTERYMENYKNVSQDIRDQLNAKAEAVQIILTGIDNDIYSTVDACPNACEMWKAIERLKQGESINVQDLETNLYWEFGKFTSRDGESLESYYSRFYKMMNELVRNQCHVTNHQVNVQFLLQLQPEWQRFVTLVKQSQELKTVSYHKLYDILKQHQNEVNEIRAERLARTANPLALVAQQQPVYHHQNHPTQNTQYSSTRSQQSTRNRGKAIVTSSAPTYDPEPATVTEDEEMSKEKEIDKLMALISLSGIGYDDQRAVNVAGDRENVVLEEMVADLRYFNSLEHEVDTLKSQLETQKTQFLNEIDRLSREYYYADHMNAILGVYTDLDEFTNLQCDYVETWEKCEHLEKELSKSTMSKSFEALQKHAINLELDLQQYSLAKKDFSKSKPVTTQNVSNDFSKPVTAHILPQNMLPIVKNTNVIAPGMCSNSQYLDLADHSLKSQLSGRSKLCLTIVREDAKIEVEDNVESYIRDLKGNDLLTSSRGTVLSKDETPGVLIDFLTLVQRGLHAQVSTVRTDKGTEFLNKTLHAYFAKEGIRHETSTARTPEQNGVVERRNRTLVEAARTMLSAAKVPLFFWAESKGLTSVLYNENKMMIVETIPCYNLTELQSNGRQITLVDPIHQCSTTVLEQDSLSLGPQSQENVPQVAETVTTSNELELLYSLMFSELLNGTSPVVSKSSAVHAADNPDKYKQHNTTHIIQNDVADPASIDIHSYTSTQTISINCLCHPENITQA
ncbi:integrase, catalytic region, zinc finger, CCHC-type containing protein [Tanacetum coccineum]